jgi:hypothetical protein
MLAVNVAVVIGVFLYKITLPPYIPYIHLLVEPVWLVFALAGAA